MMTNLEIKNIISNNLTDNRMFSIQLFINNLIARTKFGNGINQYRIKNTTTNTYITNLSEFITNIDETKLRYNYYFSNEVTESDKVHPFIVSINNYIVELDKDIEEDMVYTNMFGNNSRIAFLMSYVSDGDSVLPIKLINVKLIY